ncbi:uncharacterized protein [Montipora foliosa]|uniref:uncharacterized protein n=1 Tax=Montipora foliosa TaxID=591990 RepID=UPI0035F1FD93
MRNAISPAEQLAVTLRFLATGETYTSLQYQFRINKGTLSLIIPRVCEAISTVLASYITCPSSEEEWLEIAKRFHSRWQLPNCIGAIDGKHVRILHPPGTGSDYFNYKGFFSIVLMAVVGPNAEFVFADVGCQGRISDGGVLRNTVFYHALEAKQLNIPEPKPLPVNDAIVEEWDTLVPHYFVGDDAFSLTENVMKPYAKRGISEEQRVFNYRLSRARRVSENAFGILSAKFRMFHSTLCVKPKNAISIVHSCLALHNFLIKKCPTVYTPPGSLDYENENGEVIAGEWRQTGDNKFENLALPGMNHTRSASQMRDYLSEYVNGPGQVPWQWGFFYLRSIKARKLYSDPK